MSQNHYLSIVEAYYRGYVEKNLDASAALLHDDVRFKSPLVETTGKKAVIDAARKMVTQLQGIDVRARFESGKQAVLIYDMRLEGMKEPVRTAAMMGFEGDLISSIELFFDGAPFAKH